MSHADYLIHEPEDLNEKYKDDFRKIFIKFATSHPFKTTLYEDTPAPAKASVK
ncbi:hypothetical protein D3C75_1254070 [compost metagenome]